jgi:carbonic anhydrase
MPYELPAPGHPLDPARQEADRALDALRLGADLRSTTADRQLPRAAVVACSDSRSDPEAAFNQQVGDVFSIRTAGAVLDRAVLASIHFAIEELGVKLVVVLGHTRCGAVTAAKGALASGEVDDSPVGHIVSEVLKHLDGLDPDGELDEMVRIHTEAVADEVRAELRTGAHGDDVRVVSAVLDIASGRIAWAEDADAA